jgi:2-keto-4-pentenoate hydratase
VDKHNRHQASMILAERRGSGIAGERLAEKYRPNNFEHAFLLQQDIAAHICQQANSRILGWKCLVPIQDEAVGTKNIVAPIFANTSSQTAVSSNLLDNVAISHDCALFPTSNNTARVEPELAFELKCDLPSRVGIYTEAEIDTAIGATRLALEIIQSRYNQPSELTFYEALADGLVNQGLYLGPVIEFSDNTPLDQFDLRLVYDDKEPAQEMAYQAFHPNINPRAGLYWLVNFLSQQGIGLNKGQQVITGSYAGVIELPLDQNITFIYGNLGRFSTRFVSHANVPVSV